jgi:hypothetical protein
MTPLDRSTIRTGGEEQGVNTPIKLPRAWNYGRKLAHICLGPPMTQRRWPTITTSISGIAPEQWEGFKARAKARGMTFQAATEAAIGNLAEAIAQGEPISWPHAMGGKVHPVQMHHEVRDVMHWIVKQTGHRQNVVVLAAMLRWMERND